MEGSNENMQHFEKNENQESSNIASAGEDVIGLIRADRLLRPSNSAIPMFPSASYMSSADGEEEKVDAVEDDSIKIVFEDLNAVPELNVEVNEDSSEIILDFLKKDVKPYHGCFSSKCSLRENDLGLCVIFNIGNQVLNNKGKSEETPVRPTPQPPPRRTALHCGICSESHVKIFKSGKNLMSSVCGHVFCNVCVDHCEESHKKCLTCGKKLTRKQYHNLYQ